MGRNVPLVGAIRLGSGLVGPKAIDCLGESGNPTARRVGVKDAIAPGVGNQGLNLGQKRLCGGEVAGIYGLNELLDFGAHAPAVPTVANASLVTRGHSLNG